MTGYEMNQSSSPKKAYDRFKLSEVQKVNLKAGNLRDMKSTPKSRPTLLWQPEILDAKFDFENYLQKKKERLATH